MRKKFEVLWSAEAAERLAEVINYLRVKWSEREVNAFIRKVQKFELLVSRFPEIYAESNFKRGYRRAVITRQTSIIYFIDKDKIRIYTLFDNRQNPLILR